MTKAEQIEELERWEAEYQQRIRTARAEAAALPKGSGPYYLALVRQDDAKRELEAVRAELAALEASPNKAGGRGRRRSKGKIEFRAPSAQRAVAHLQRAASELHALAQAHPERAHSLSLAVLDLDTIIRGLQ